jgi:hypothetical protein
MLEGWELENNVWMWVVGRQEGTKLLAGNQPEHRIG